MRQPLVSFASIALALMLALSSSSLTARAASGGVVYDLPDIGPGSGAGIVFVDALQQASGWHSATPGTLKLDADGNVRSLLPGQSAERTVYTNEVYPAGDYALLYDGAGRFDVSGGSIVAISSGRATVRVGANSGAGLTLLMTATDSSNPVRNVRLILPGYETTYATQPFIPSFVRALLGRNVLRFAQWMHADTFVDSTFWTQRPRVGRVTQVTLSGVAPEYMILLANLTGASPWFTLPVGATDGYVANFAALVHRTLDPRLSPVFQYGSEVWNPSAPANGYARMAARNVGIPGDTASAALGWYTRRSARVLSLVRVAFGSNGSRVVRALSGPLPATRDAGALDAFLLRSTNGAIDAFAVPVASPADLASAARLALLSHLQTYGYAAQPATVAAMQPVTQRPPGNARLVLGTDLPANDERQARPKPVAGFSTVPPLRAKGALDLGGRAGVKGALGVPLPQVDFAREGTLDWIELRGAAVAARKTSVPPQLSAVTLSGGSFGLSVPADVRERILRVYVSVDRAQGTLSATLGNSTFTDSSLSARTGTRTGVYTLVYRAAAPGQQLTVRYSAQATFGGNVSVQGATLNAMPLVPNTAPPSDEALYHNDLVRTGWNPSEFTLTTTNVAASFKQLQTIPVDGEVLAQPLYLGQYSIAGGLHNVLLVVTENDSVYEFDADSGTVLNHVSMGTPQNSDCSDVQPTYGITSTPVINRSTGTIYVVAATEPTSGNPVTTVHALDIATLSDKVTPVVVSASVMLNNGSMLSFDPVYQYNRPGLVWANNSLYISVGSHCDYDANQIAGWVLRYNSSLSQTGVFSTIGDPTGDCAGYSLSSVWMSGFAPAVDAFGYLYLVTGNGAFDANAGGHDYGESVLKLKPDLSQVHTYFTPNNFNDLNCGDADFGSGGVMLLPRGPLLAPQAAVAMGKSSVLYLLSTLNLGGEKANDAGALQVIGLPANGLWGGPAFYSGPTGQFVYYQSGGDVLRAYQVSYTAGPAQPLTSGSVQPLPISSPGPFAQLALSSTGTSGAGYGGSTPIVSSNGQMPGTGIVWLVQRGSGNLALEAYDASDVSNLLFHASAGTWSNSENNGFVTPLVANGKVYVPSSNAITVFGL
jgi:hypothetical protein